MIRCIRCNKINKKIWSLGGVNHHVCTTCWKFWETFQKGCEHFSRRIDPIINCLNWENPDGRCHPSNCKITEYITEFFI